MGLMISGPSMISCPHHVLRASNTCWPKQRAQVFPNQFKMRVTYFSFQALNQKKAGFVGVFFLSTSAVLVNTTLKLQQKLFLNRLGIFFQEHLDELRNQSPIS